MFGLNKTTPRFCDLKGKIAIVTGAAKGMGRADSIKLSMVNVTQYINKSKDSVLLANLKQIPTLATQYFVKNNTYAGFGADSELYNIFQAISKNYPYSSGYNLYFIDEAGYFWNEDDSYHATEQAGIAGKWYLLLQKNAGEVDYGKIACIDSDGALGLYSTPGFVCGFQ